MKTILNKRFFFDKMQNGLKKLYFYPNIFHFMQKVLFFLTFVFFSISFRSNAQVLINEYTAANWDVHSNPTTGKFEDWFEIYNPTGAVVDISGWFLSDDVSDLTKWAIPAGVTVAPSGFLMVYCNGDNTYAGGALQADFKLTQCASEEIVISNTMGLIVDSVTIKKTQKNHSRARLVDGGSVWGVSDNPSPDISNTGVYIGYAKRPDFSLVRGFYSGTQMISLSSTEPTAHVIRYTTDGTDPTPSSTLYSGAIAVSTTTIIKACTFSSDPTVLPSFVEFNTYFIDVNTTMPVVSLGGDLNTMFSGWGGGAETESSIEYYNIAHVPQFKVWGTTRPHGNDSWAYDQKGFRYYVWDEMGYDNKMEQYFFANSTRNDFDVIILKAAGSDNFPTGMSSSGQPSCHLRDGFAQQLSMNHNLNLDERSLSHCIIYINGEYWGIYEIRERVDVDFTEYYYNQGKKDVDILKYWGGLNIEEGSDTGWVNIYNYIMTNSMATPSNYTYASSKLDMMSFIDYFILNTYLVNTDWLNWNTMWWRGRAGTGVKWRYTLWDCDNILDLGQNYTGLPTTTYTGDPCDVTSTGIGGNPDEGHIDMLEALLENPDFEELYLTRYADLMNTTFNCTVMNALLDSLQAVLEPEMPNQLARWGGASMTDWYDNLDHIRGQIDGRCTVIAGGFNDCYDTKGPYNLVVNVSPAGAGKVQVNTIIPSTYPYTASYFGGVNTNLTATANSGWTFSHWTIGIDTLLPNTTASEVYLTLDTNDIVIAYFSYDGPIDTTPPPPPPPPPPVEDTFFGLPGIFTPNGDGLNDVLYVLGNTISDIKFVIYDRWGEIVFQTTDKNMGWDGTFRNQPLNSGVFAYTLEYTNDIDNKRYAKNGNITLIR